MEAGIHHTYLPTLPVQTNMSFLKLVGETGCRSGLVHTKLLTRVDITGHID